MAVSVENSADVVCNDKGEDKACDDMISKKDDGSSKTSAKRQKKDGSSNRWKVTFDQLSTLRHVMEILVNIIDSATFRIDSEGMKLNCIDSKQICMVELSMSHTGFTSSNENASFCLYTRTLRDCLKASPSHYSLEISNPDGTSDIFLRSYEALSNSHQFEVRIPSIVEDESPCNLCSMEFAAVVEVDMNMLRGIIKTAIALGSTDTNQAKDCDIRFQIYKKEPTSEDNTGITVLCISSNSGQTNAQPRHIFVSETSEDGVFRTEDTINAEVDVSDMPCVYNEAFSSNYLNSFVKSMERQTLTMKCASGLPLIIEYPLGREGSHITFILAARLEEDED